MALYKTTTDQKVDTTRRNPINFADGETWTRNPSVINRVL